MRFDWDETKAALNIENHNVTFEEAQEVFDDNWAVVVPDDAHSFGEQRYRIIGASSQRLLLVVYVERAGDVIRIISAREPESYERRVYYEGEKGW
ncbi:MAG: BrnT family toxin [Acidobacteria bacterium]|nr:BrnT family toxin [Acidobacteriota bacterium]